MKAWSPGVFAGCRQQPVAAFLNIEQHPVAASLSRPARPRRSPPACSLQQKPLFEIFITPPQDSLAPFYPGATARLHQVSASINASDA